MKFSPFAFLAGLFFLAAITSCNKSIEDISKQELDLKRVLYGSDTAQNLDIYLPAGRDTANTKVILFIHGGAWNSGDKNDFNDAIAAIQPKLTSYAIFNMNYRFATNDATRFPVQLNDIESAIAFIENKAVEYKVNVHKVCLVGASAGAHLALLEAYKNNGRGRIKAVVDLFGPTDLTDLYNNHPFPDYSKPVLVNFLGATPASNPSIYQQSSPINFVNTRSVPTCIFHGTDDFVVPAVQSNTLKAKLAANNVKVEMTIYAGEGHGWEGSNLLDTYAKSVQFIQANVY